MSDQTLSQINLLVQLNQENKESFSFFIFIICKYVINIDKTMKNVLERAIAARMNYWF